MIRKEFFTIILVLTTLTAHATRTVLRGHISSPGDSAVSLRYGGSPLNYIEDEYTLLETPVTEKGNFRLVFDIDHPVSCNMQCGKQWLFINMFINPGDSLVFIFDGDKVTIDGKGEKGIAAMFNHENSFYSGHSLDDFRGSLGLPAMEYAQFCIVRRDSELAFYNAEFNAPSAPSLKTGTTETASAGQSNDETVPQEYQDFVKKEVIYEAAVNITQYSFRGRYKRRALLCDPEYFKYLSDTRIDDKDAINIGKYLQFLGQLPKNLWQCRNDSALFDNASIAYNEDNQFRLRDSIAKKCFKGAAYDLALYSILYDKVRMLNYSKGTQAFEQHYQRADSLLNELGVGFNDKSYLERAKMKLSALRAENKPAPDFTAFTADGSKVHLSDYRGKVVFVDFWATSCIPCVGELPGNLKLQEKFRSKDVVFLYVSLDGSKDTWQRFINSHQFTGNHLIDPKGFNSEAAQQYNIAGIPRHVLVDRKGILISADAPGPASHPEELIENALNGKQ